MLLCECSSHERTSLHYAITFQLYNAWRSGAHQTQDFSSRTLNTGVSPRPVSLRLLIWNAEHPDLAIKSLTRRHQRLIWWQIFKSKQFIRSIWAEKYTYWNVHFGTVIPWELSLVRSRIVLGQFRRWWLHWSSFLRDPKCSLMGNIDFSMLHSRRRKRWLTFILLFRQDT